jgi:tRNA(Ile)-lysidine synthetase-like protein
MAETGSIFENERYKIVVSPNEHKDCTQQYENIYKLSIHKILCSDKIIGSLYIKYRNQGDTYRCGGMTKRVKKLMIDRKMTAEEKRLLPLLCDDSGILWMPGHPLRDGAEAKNGEGETIHLTFFEKTLFSNRPNLK